MRVILRRHDEGSATPWPVTRSGSFCSQARLRMTGNSISRRPQMAEILVVDDDRKTTDLIRLYLERAGYDVRVAHDGERALDLVSERAPDLLVLDLMLPKLDGLDVCV